MKTFYNWDIQPDDFVFFPGVVAGLNLCCAGLLQEDEAAVTATPVYHPFFAAPENQGRELKRFPMSYEAGSWQFPINALERASVGNSRLLMLVEGRVETTARARPVPQTPHAAPPTPPLLRTLDPLAVAKTWGPIPALGQLPVHFFEVIQRVCQRLGRPRGRF